MLSSRATINNLTMIANAIFLCYLLVLASADPRPDLCFAIACDTLFVCALFAYRRWKEKSVESKELASLFSTLAEQRRIFSLFSSASQLWSSILSSVLIVVCLYLCIDLTALLSAFFGATTFASTIYRTIAPPAVTGIHPAFSLELLSGAYIDAHNYRRAFAIDQSLLQMRRSYAGENSELVASMLTNIADLHVRAGTPDAAEPLYRDAVALSKSLHVKQGYGSPLTKLACLLRDRGKFSEADNAFHEALSIRQSIFGPNSERVAETLHEYAKSLQQQNKLPEAALLTERADRIQTSHNHHRSTAASPGAFCVFIALVSLLVLSQRDRFLSWLGNRLLKVPGRKKGDGAPVSLGTLKKAS